MSRCPHERLQAADAASHRNTLIRAALDSRDGSGQVFATGILRSQWAWQFTREWSLRLIGQYETTHTNPALAAVGVPPRILLTA